MESSNRIFRIQETFIQSNYVIKKSEKILTKFYIFDVFETLNWEYLKNFKMQTKFSHCNSYNFNSKSSKK